MIRLILALCALTALLSACGQKGPLVPAPKAQLSQLTAQAAMR